MRIVQRTIYGALTKLNNPAFSSKPDSVLMRLANDLSAAFFKARIGLPDVASGARRTPVAMEQDMVVFDVVAALLRAGIPVSRSHDPAQSYAQWIARKIAMKAGVGGYGYPIGSLYEQIGIVERIAVQGTNLADR
jgi:hypothetical protein